ncbi:MAG TPA: pilus assembly protein PilM [Arenimonas sp.]|nr:pilus assembly protein PilM [Arenimonas sp.]
MQLFGEQSAPLIGIDISSAAVKVLQLSQTAGRYRVEHYGVEPLPPNSVNDKNITQVEVVGAAIKRAVAKSGSKSKFAAVAVSGSSVITKVITVTGGLDEVSMEQQVFDEASNHIPYQMDEVSLDFEELGPIPNTDSVQVMIAAARTENVEARQAALEYAGLTAKVVDVEVFAVENAFKLISNQLDIPAGGLTAIVDIGANLTTLNIIKDGRSIYSRDQVFGGKQLSDEIMRRYGLSFNEAGAAKKLGGLPESYESEVLEPFKEGVAQQISRLLQFFYSGSDYTRVDQIVLAGGCAAISGMDRVVEQHLGVGTVVANPIASMTVSPRVQAHALAADAQALLIACGLALRSFD